MGVSHDYNITLEKRDFILFTVVPLVSRTVCPRDIFVEWKKEERKERGEGERGGGSKKERKREGKEWEGEGTPPEEAEAGGWGGGEGEEESFIFFLLLNFDPDSRILRSLNFCSFCSGVSNLY